MNILSFDIEEWYLETKLHGGREHKYKQFDSQLSSVLDLLDQKNIKATFFCLGKVASDYPHIVSSIHNRGHEIACHSNEHTWLTALTPDELRRDTQDAIKALEDVCAERITSYRAPAFTITENNKWALEILAECGIENDATVFPSRRDYGGFPSFPYDTPCLIKTKSGILREFPIGVAKVLGREMAYSGGGYFRLLPYSIASNLMKKKDYNICYFHLSDLISDEKKMFSKSEFEAYYKEPGSLKNRTIRYLKTNIGSGDAFKKLVKLVSSEKFVNMSSAVELINWSESPIVEL